MAPTKRKAISLEVKQRIHRDFRQGFKVGSLAKRYELSQSTISTIIKAGDVLKKAGTSGHDDQRKRVRDPLYGDVEDSLYQWFLTTRNRNVPISGPILAAKAKKFASLLGRENFEPGGGWIQRFKDRHGIVYKNVVGEAASLDVNAKDEWLATKLPELLERFQESDIFNGDETALFYEMLPTKTHALKGDPCVGGKHSKVRVTVFVCANMDGTERLKPFVIGKSKRPHCFRNQCIPVRYRNNKKAWMTRDLFEEWLLEFDGAMEKQKRKVVLLLDNCSAHNVSPKLTSVEVMFLPPNTATTTAATRTPRLQCLHKMPCSPSSRWSVLCTQKDCRQRTRNNWKQCTRQLSNFSSSKRKFPTFLSMLKLFYSHFRTF